MLVLTQAVDGKAVGFEVSPEWCGSTGVIVGPQFEEAVETFGRGAKRLFVVEVDEESDEGGADRRYVAEMHAESITFRLAW